MLRKRAKASITLLVFVLLIGIITVLALNYFIDSAEEEKQQLAKSIKTTNRKLKILEQNIEKALASQDLFEQLVSDDEKMAISRENAVGVLSRLRKENMLGTVSLTMTPIQHIKHRAFKRQSTQVEYTTITLKFNGITDKFIFDFIRSVRNEFSGYIRVRKFTLAKVANVDKNVLLELSYGRHPMLVDGMIVFDWFGIKYDKK